MAKAQIDISLDTDGLVAQLAALRQLCSHVGWALDTAILKLECNGNPPENGSTLPQYDGSDG